VLREHVAQEVGIWDHVSDQYALDEGLAVLVELPVLADVLRAIAAIDDRLASRLDERSETNLMPSCEPRNSFRVP